MLSEELTQIPAISALAESYGAAILEGGLSRGEAALYVDPVRIIEICRFLKDEQGFSRLSGVTAVDWHPVEPRFEVVYLLQSLPAGQGGPPQTARLRLKCRLHGEAPEIDSVYGVWRGADWYEREVFDLFGIRFREHPNLTRILLPEGWQGHPLRRDYPKHGHKYDYGEET
ncbi:MAG: NADH-quinone oxidoreductase subunit C [Acidobacteria bacterium]|nr:NADH-quinone oxidoreductase subunit C [Acidobacteriota bacterium]MBI3282285.1 NADH-quinone oxidoreductase subunit C [Acidobacteriota bacterium]